MFGSFTGFFTTLLLLEFGYITPAFAGFFHWRSRTRNTGSCDRKITNDGRFTLTGATQPSLFKFPPYCAMKILSGPNTKIRLTFQNPKAYQCSDRSYVAVLDGWLISDGLRRSQTFIPESEDMEQKREKVICVNEGDPTPQVLESSRNLAEIVYKLQHGHQIDVVVQFIPKNQSCDVVLGDEDVGREFMMETSEAGVCRWYLPGGAAISIHEFSLLARYSPGDAKCEGNRVLVKSGDSYSDLVTYKTVCTPQDIQRPIPTYCKHTVVELHSEEPETKQFVKFSFELSANRYQALTVCSNN